MTLKMSSTQNECYFTPKRFLELLEKEREWFDMFICVGLLPGTRDGPRGRGLLISRDFSFE